MDKMREEFETWVKSYAEKIKYKYMDRVLLRDSADGYMSTWVDSAWIGWKASRAALCVGLPSFENGSIRGYSGDCEEASMVVDCVAESLEKAGVSYE